MEKTILRSPDICSLLGVSQPTFYRWIRVGRFPKGIKYGPRVVGWPRELVEKWLTEKQTAGR